MPFDWLQYLHLARFLLKNSGEFSQEAAHRCATSRAYYAAFCHARNYAQKHKGYIPQGTGEDHIMLQAYLNGHGMENVARWLDQLRGWRNDCDYKNEIFQSLLQAENAIKVATMIFEALGK